MKYLLTLVALLVFAAQTHAINTWNYYTLGSEYDVVVTATPIDADSWTFSYLVKNINQQRGLDGFSVQTPLGATIANLVVPPSYSSGGSWVAGVDATKVFWSWGLEEASVYPPGTEATFGFDAHGVAVGEVDAWITTYNQPYVYSQFSTRLQGPVGVPDGGTTLALLGLSLTGLGLIRRRLSR